MKAYCTQSIQWSQQSLWRKVCKWIWLVLLRQRISTVTAVVGNHRTASATVVVNHLFHGVSHSCSLNIAVGRKTCVKLVARCSLHIRRTVWNANGVKNILGCVQKTVHSIAHRTLVSGRQTFAACSRPAADG